MNAEQEIRAKLGDFAADQDLMRDVYMSRAQREAYERILARALQQQGGSEGVRGLPAKWRAKISADRHDVYHDALRDAYEVAADELDAALDKLSKENRDER